MTDQNWQKWVPQDTWGAYIEYQPEFVEDKLAEKHLSDEDAERIISAIEQESNYAEVDVPSLGIVMDDFQWSTGFDFGHEYEGGGYSIGFGYGDMISRLFVCVEYYDTYAEESGHEERKDEGECARIGIDVLREFMASL